MTAKSSLDNRALELQAVARQFQINTTLSGRPITDPQLKKLQITIREFKLEESRAQRLEALRIILGYERPLNSSKDLSMADAMGLFELKLEEFQYLYAWALFDQSESGVVV